MTKTIQTRLRTQVVKTERYVELRHSEVIEAILDWLNNSHDVNLDHRDIHRMELQKTPDGFYQLVWPEYKSDVADDIAQTEEP